MIAEISFWGAFLAGVISFLSPCVLPLVPPYLCYMAGASLEELTSEDAQEIKNKWKIFISSLLFVLGFSTVFVSLGVGASSASNFITVYSGELTVVAGVIIIIFGLHFLGVFKISALYREFRYHGGATSKMAGPAGSYLMGFAFGFGWTPCVGPVLGTLLVMASKQETVSQATWLMIAYSAGLGIPFILSALGVKQFTRFLTKFKRHLGTVEKIMGVLLILTGFAFIFNLMNEVAFWIIEYLPFLSDIEGLVS